MKSVSTILVVSLMLVTGVGVLAQSSIAQTSQSSPSEPSSKSLAPDSRLFELRTYYVVPQKMEALHARFRDQTNKLFAKHGMQIVGYWVPKDKDGQYENKLVYMLTFPGKEAQEKSWKEFQADPDWKKVREVTEKGGKIVEKVESVNLTATDYSPIK